MKFKCSSCGEVFTEQLDTCPKCGGEVVLINKPEVVGGGLLESLSTKQRKKLKAELMNEILHPETKEINKETPTVDTNEKSFFDGYTIQYIGWYLLGLLLTSFTLGICYPISIGMIERWKAKHTVINGYRLTFVGSLASLLPRWILWMLLTILTLGIFGLTLPVRIEKWKVSRLVLLPINE